LLITKEFGPRVRIAKIFTDLPLKPDEPIDFGVTEFCNNCQRCANGCPPRAIPDGAPNVTVHNVSNFKGIAKWTVNAEKCFKFWTNQGTDCSICIRICPYNKDFSNPIHRVGRWLAGTPLRRLMLWLDIKLKYGERKNPRWWWGR